MLEKGVVDGAAQIVIGALDYKWYEVVKYLLRPTFGNLVEMVLVNRDTWNKLPKDLQNLVLQVTREMEEEGYKALSAYAKYEEEKLLRLGMELNVFPSAEGEKLVNAFYQQSWKELAMKYSPDFSSRFKKPADEFVKRRH